MKKTASIAPTLPKSPRVVPYTIECRLGPAAARIFLLTIAATVFGLLAIYADRSVADIDQGEILTLIAVVFFVVGLSLLLTTPFRIDVDSQGIAVRYRWPRKDYRVIFASVSRWKATRLGLSIRQDVSKDNPSSIRDLGHYVVLAALTRADHELLVDTLRAVCPAQERFPF